MRIVAFFSYTRADDRAANGLLSAMRKLLQDQVSGRLGEPVEVFQDTDDIKAGEDWRARLDKALAEATYLIPVITPSFFNSGPCREELNRFVEKAKREQRNGLIVPLHFIDSPVILDEASTAKDALAKVIEETQWIDLRDHDHKTEIDSELRKALVDLAKLLAEKVRQDDLDASRKAKEAVERRAREMTTEALVGRKLQSQMATAAERRLAQDGTTTGARTGNKQAATNRRAWIVGSAAVTGITLALVIALNLPRFTEPATRLTTSPGEDLGTQPSLAEEAQSSTADDTGAFPVGRVFRECDGCPEMVVIPGGSFVMGSPEGEAGRQNDEGPQREVRIEKFAMGRHEVTFEEWDACVVRGFCRAVENDEEWGRGRRPVINVSWQDITGEDVPERGFLAWMNEKVEGAPYRLPSEAEWEYAARAGTTTMFAFGDEIAAYQANFGENFEGGRTSPVGTYPANAFGLYDMHGNVWEWVQDCQHNTNQGAPIDGSAWMDSDGGFCSLAIARGGSWGGGAARVRSSIRARYWRTKAHNFLGFRLARTLPGD